MKPIKYLLVLFSFLSLPAICQTGKKSGHFLTLDSSLQTKLDSIINIGNSYYMLGQLNISIEYYDKALKLNPNFAKAYFNRGNSNFDLGLTKQACEDWVKAIELGHEEAEDFVIKNCR